MRNFRGVVEIFSEGVAIFFGMGWDFFGGLWDFFGGSWDFFGRGVEIFFFLGGGGWEILGGLRNFKRGRESSGEGGGWKGVVKYSGGIKKLKLCDPNLNWMWPLRIICVVLVFATVESNFTTYTGCQLQTNENYHLIHSHLIYSFSRWILMWVWICCFVSFAIRKIYIWTISNSRDNNFHHDCYKLYIIISWVAICKFINWI